MTEQAPPAPALIDVESAPFHARLAQLAYVYDQQKEAADTAAAALRATVDAIKVELVNAAAGSNDIRLSSPDLAQQLQLVAVTGERIDTKRLRAEQPAMCDYYTTPTVQWRLQKAPRA